jgi:hypothetical protein
MERGQSGGPQTSWILAGLKDKLSIYGGKLHSYAQNIEANHVKERQNYSDT